MTADDRIRALRDALEYIHGELSKAGVMPDENSTMRVGSAFMMAEKALQEDDEAAVGLRSPV